MELKIKSQIGSMNEEIMISKDGKDLLIGFNPKFLIDALRVIDDEEVTFFMLLGKDSYIILQTKFYHKILQKYQNFLPNAIFKKVFTNILKSNSQERCSR